MPSAALCVFSCFFFNDTATTEIYTLSLHDALPIYEEVRRISEECYAEARRLLRENRDRLEAIVEQLLEHETLDEPEIYARSEEHTSELQSRQFLVCRLPPEKKINQLPSILHHSYIIYFP